MLCARLISPNSTLPRTCFPGTFVLRQVCRTTVWANLVYFLEALATVQAFRGEAERSAVLIGAAEALLEESGERVHKYYVSDSSESSAVVPGSNWSMVAVFQKSLQLTVTNVTTVTLGREPHREGLFSVTIGVTVTGFPSKGPSRRTPLEMGSVTAVTVVTMNCRTSLMGVRHSLWTER